MNINEDLHKKEAYVQSLFSSIAPKYDLLNSVISFNRHKAWRRFAVSKSDLQPGSCALDVCCGTGDFCFNLAEKVGKSGRVIGVDFSKPMIALAMNKAIARGYENIDFIVGNACNLPFDKDSFDCVTVGFGLRNIPYIELALSEMVRVLRPGGRLISLEITGIRPSLLRWPWMLYFNIIMPYIAKLFRARGEAYEYLPESVKVFMSREELAAAFERAGLKDINYF